MSYCSEELRELSRPYPRTCPRCGLGPCRRTVSERNDVAAMEEEAIKELRSYATNLEHDHLDWEAAGVLVELIDKLRSK